MKPVHTVIYLLSIASVSWVILFIFPNEGIIVSKDLTIKYATLGEVLSVFKPQEEEQRTIENILEQAEVIEIDSTAIKDSIRIAQIERHNQLLGIQYPDSVTSPLKTFYKSLQRLPSGSKIRVLHYGDSQIEGDRITNLLRNKLQKKYGGYGPGLLSVTPIARTTSVRMRRSDNWKRYTVFGSRSNILAHDKFGLMASFSRYASLHPLDIKPEFRETTIIIPVRDPNTLLLDSLLTDNLGKIADTEQQTLDSIFNQKNPDTLKAWIELESTRRSYHRLRKFSQLHILLGNNHNPITLKMIINDSTEETQRVPSLDQPLKISYSFPNTPKKIRLEFEGFGSPDIYGISLESKNGIIVDNISMRGSSGTIFRKMDTKTLSTEAM